MSSEAILPLGQFGDAATTAAQVPAVENSVESRVDSAAPGEASDESLLVAVGSGSKEALSLLFRRHATTVFNVAQRILRDESEAADLRQDVFLYLFQRARLYDPTKGPAVSWIIQITYHRAFDRRRFLAGRQHYQVDQLDQQRVEDLTCQLSLDQLDGKRILERLKNQLTHEQQETLDLHLFHGYSFQEIAERSGQPVGNVRHYYYRGLERLRSNLFSKKRG